MPDFLITKISDALNGTGKSAKGAKIHIIGVAYKKDVSDTRESPALDVMELLKKKKAKISYHDPHVPSFEFGGTRHRSQALNPRVLKQQDCVVIITNHTALDMKAIVAGSRLVVDARNATKGIRDRRIVKL